jgi:hypothetical protein
MKTLSTFLCFFLFLIQATFPQKVLHEFRGGDRRNGFKIHAIGDSILLQFDESLPSGGINRSYWITGEATTGDKIDEDVLAVVKTEGRTYFYYLDGRAKSRTLKALVAEGSTKNPVEASIPINGTLIGKTAGHHLTLYTLDDDGLTLTIRLINGMTVAVEKKFKLSANLHDNATENGIDFFSASTSFTSFKGLANIKFYHSDSVMYVTLDRSRLTTLVMRLDLKTGEVTTKAIPFSGPENFNSFYLDGKLFRVFNTKRKFELSVYDVATGTLLAKNEIPDTVPDFKVYFRYGRKNIISHKALFHQMTGDAKVSWPSIAVEKVDDKYIIQWGGYYNQNSGGIVAPTPTLAGVLTAVIATTVLQLREKPGVLRYFYNEWDGGTGFKVRDYPPSTQLPREKIDDYEIVHQPRVSEKSYVQYKNGIVAFYYDRPENYLSVVYFD